MIKIFLKSEFMRIVPCCAHSKHIDSSDCDTFFEFFWSVLLQRFFCIATSFCTEQPEWNWIRCICKETIVFQQWMDFNNEFQHKRTLKKNILEYNRATSKLIKRVMWNHHHCHRCDCVQLTVASLLHFVSVKNKSQII